MPEQKEVLLETVLQQKKLEINNVYVKRNVTFFSINGNQFCTYDKYVYHKYHTFYDHPALYSAASYHHDPEKIAEEEHMQRQAEREQHLWDKHKNHVYSVVFVGAIEVLKREGIDAFVRYIDEHVGVWPEDGAKLLLNKLG